MIYLHHQSLANVLHDCQTPSEQKTIIAQYRHDLLNKFCQQNQLPTPIYARTPYGKPVATNVANLAFNQSHTLHDYALIYGFDVPNLGVDIECLNRQANFESLARRYFHADEQALWHEHGKDKTWWFKIWTIKEAVLKANGLGIRLPLNTLNAKFDHENQGVLCHDELGCYRFECVLHDHCVISFAYPNDCGEQAWCWG